VCPSPVYKEFERGDKFGPNGIEAGVYKFVLRGFQRNPGRESRVEGLFEGRMNENRKR